MYNKCVFCCSHKRGGLSFLPQPERAQTRLSLIPSPVLISCRGLSRLLLSAKRSCDLKGIEVATNLFISHLLFVDDILLFSNGSREDVSQLKSSLDLFLKAIGMSINAQKSSIAHEGLSSMDLDRIATSLPYEVLPMGDSLKYLGFPLNSDSKNQDWNWLLSKIEKRINLWSYKWLSRTGRLVLIKSVLVAIPVYWIALTWVPKGILSKIRKLCSHFL